MKRIQTGLLVAGLLSAGAVLAQPGPGFFGADTDGDGRVSRAEANAALDERFALLDTDGDGAISRDEIAQRRDGRRERFAERGRERFAAADTDGDGALSLAELQAVNPNVTQERFEIMDTDANGLITADERPMRPGRPGRPGRGFGPGRP